jgi:hypothetical protein
MQHGETYTPTFGRCEARIGYGKWNEHPFGKQTSNQPKNQATIFGIDKVDKSDANVTTASFAYIRAGPARIDFLPRKLPVLASNPKEIGTGALQGPKGLHCV